MHSLCQGLRQYGQSVKVTWVLLLKAGSCLATACPPPQGERWRCSLTLTGWGKSFSYNPLLIQDLAEGLVCGWLVYALAGWPGLVCARMESGMEIATSLSPFSLPLLPSPFQSNLSATILKDSQRIALG